ncbi:hypothetical protein [Armatimonas sp.]|uniref:hypothetical protein n=1 Tax=Armatimonas sp. TaxID=1872638 RepID=UPI003750339D
MKKLSIGIVFVLILYIIYSIYNKAKLNEEIEYMYQKQLKIMMILPDDNLKLEIRKASECRVKASTYHQIDDSYLIYFLENLKKANLVPVSPQLIQKSAILTGALEGTRNSLSKDQKQKILDVMVLLSNTHSGDVITILLILCNELQSKECVPILNKLYQNANPETQIQINAYLQESKFWEGDEK